MFFDRARGAARFSSNATFINARRWGERVSGKRAFDDGRGSAGRRARWDF